MGWRTEGTETFVGRIRSAAAELAAEGKEISTAALSHAVGVQTYKDNQKIHWAIRDMMRRGELERTGKRGCYACLDKLPHGGEKREVMWRFLRIRNSNGHPVTAGDLQEAAGVSEAYAQEWLRMLRRRGVVKPGKDGKSWWLTADAATAEAPRNDAKAEKLRKLRARRKANLIAIIDDAQMRLQEAVQRLDEARGELVGSD